MNAILEQTQAVTLPQPFNWLFDGIFTISSPKGEHRTFRVRTIRYEEGIDPQSFEGKNIGRQIVSILSGSDNNWNSKDWRGLAFADRLVEANKVWKNCIETNHKSAGVLVALVRQTPAGLKMIDLGYKLEESRRCFCCGKILTTPASIAAGVGPVCAKKD